MMVIVSFIFWVSYLLLFYTYIGYPMLIGLWALFFPKPVKKEEYLPYITVVISVYNEEQFIAKRIENLLTIDYPKEKMQILIGSDGSTDKTNQILKEYANKGVIKVYVSSQRQGKPAMLNTLLSEVNSDIVVFTDARQQFAPQAVKQLVANFADQTVGCVSGELLYRKEKTAAWQGVNVYWRYEKWLRKRESEVHSMIGATGAIYAIRRKLFSALPEDIILDDVYIPLLCVKQGYRAIFEPEAVCWDYNVKLARQEFLRKVRTIVGNFQLFKIMPWLFSFKKNPIFIQVVSHKFLRAIAFFFLFSLFFSSYYMAYLGMIYLLIYRLQVVFYLGAILGMIFSMQKKPLPVFSGAYMFCVMNLAALFAFFRFVQGRYDVRWQRVFDQKDLCNKNVRNKNVA